MSYPPSSTVTVRDGGLGLVSTAEILPLVVGRTSTGTDLAVTTHYSAQSVRDALGVGPAAEMAAILADAGGCHVLRIAGTTAGVASAVTKAAVGTSTGTVTLTGAPHDQYDAIIEITATDNLGAGRYRISLDGGNTYGGERTIPSGGTAPIGDTGVTATFVPGIGPTYFEDGDLHTWTSTAPAFSAAEFTAAFAAGTAAHAFLRGSTVVEQMFVAGTHASAHDAVLIGAAIETLQTSLRADNVFLTYLADAGSGDVVADVRAGTGVVGAIGSTTGGYCYGYATRPTALTGEGWGTPALPLLASVSLRAALVDPSENLGRRRSGPLTGVIAVSQDEGIAQAFAEADRIITSTSRRGDAGFFVTNGYCRSPADSDFLYYDYARLVARACRLAYVAQSKWTLSKVRTRNDGTGRIAEVDAKRIEAAIQGVLDEALLKQPNAEGFDGYCSACTYAVDRTNNVQSTRTIRGTIAIVPLPPVEGISTVVGLTSAA